MLAVTGLHLYRSGLFVFVLVVVVVDVVVVLVVVVVVVVGSGDAGGVDLKPYHCLKDYLGDHTL